MSFEIIDDEVDIVIAALRPDLTSFFEGWRPIFSRFHLIIIKDPGLQSNLQIPPGFDHEIYTKSDMYRLIGSSSMKFTGRLCRYFGYLVSSKKYIISIDDDCMPATDISGNPIDAVVQHLTNLKTPATPFFFNTLYDPFREGADFVRGYPFSLRNGVECALSAGLWLNAADYDAPTRATKPHETNGRYVDAVLTIPLGAMMPISGINIAFDRRVLGPAFMPALQLKGEGRQRWEALDDIWCGLCAKVVCDHLGLGAKTGLPYVWKNASEDGDICCALKGEWEGVKLLEDIVPFFFQSLKLPRTTVTAEDCVVQIASLVRERLGSVDPVIFGAAADAMDEWVKLWRTFESRRR